MEGVTFTWQEAYAYMCQGSKVRNTLMTRNIYWMMHESGQIVQIQSDDGFKWISCILDLKYTVMGEWKFYDE